MRIDLKILNLAARVLMGFSLGNFKDTEMVDCGIAFKRVLLIF